MAYSLSLKMEGIYSSEMPASLQTAWHYSPEDYIFRSTYRVVIKVVLKLHKHAKTNINTVHTYEM
jgi:hypothetical protein